MTLAPLAIAGLLVTAGMLASCPAGAQLRSYQLDPVHTRIVVSVEHAGFSRSIGTLSGSAGHLAFDPDDWRSARVDVEIPIPNLDFGDADWNAAVLARAFLDADRYPTARFTSTAVEPADDGILLIHGDLQLRGVTAPVTLQTRLNAVRRYPLPPFRRTAGFSATTRVDRTAFGMNAWRSLIGIEVDIQLEVEAWQTRQGPDDDMEDGTPVAPERPGRDGSGRHPRRTDDPPDGSAAPARPHAAGEIPP